MFMRPVIQPEAGWSVAFDVILNGTSAPIGGSFEAAADNRTVIFTPSSSLQDNRIYRIKVSDELLQENGLPVLPVGNTTWFKVRPAMLQVSVITPEDLESEPQPLDVEVVLGFGYLVDRSLLESFIDISPPVTGISFRWTSGSEVSVSALFSSDTSYTLSIPQGDYGLDGESLGSQFQVVFQTGSGYSKDHSFTSINLIPEPGSGWETSQAIIVSGTADNSEGYQVSVMIGDISNTTTVSQDTTWSLQVVLPEDEMEGKMIISIGVPGGPFAYTKEYDVVVRSPDGSSDNEEEEDDNTMIYIALASAFILLIIILAVVYMRAQRKKAEEDVDITEVDSDWSDDEE
jgi:hypothetical protein